MAVRSEELTYQRDAVVYRFPSARLRRRAQIEVRRRRAALAAVGLVVVVAGLFASGPEGSAPAAPRTGRTAVVLHEGETLWELAARHAPAGMDVRTYIDAILERNGLSAIPGAGTRLRLP